MKRLFSALAISLLLAICAAAQTAPKTHVVDYLHDASGNPLSGKVTFLLAQKSASTPDGLVVASPSVSAVLDSAGKFDVWLYPSTSLSPVAYYNVDVTSGAGNQTRIGIYNIPSSSSVITLAPYKVTDTNLAAQYTFADMPSVLALTKTVSTQTYVSLLGALTAGRHAYYNGAGLSSSIVGEANTTATVNGNLSVTGVMSGNASGLSNLPGTPSGPAFNSLSSDTSGWAKYQATGTGVGTFDLYRNSESIMHADATGVTTIPKLKLPGKSLAQYQLDPSLWYKYENTISPAFRTTSLSGACADLSGEDRNAEAKMFWLNNTLYGLARAVTHLNLCKSTDYGRTWSYVGVALSVGGSYYDSGFGNQIPLYHTGDSVISVWFLGFHDAGGGNFTYGTGYATCTTASIIAGSPACTVQTPSPILTSSTCQTDFGFSTSVYQCGISAVWQVGGQWRFSVYAYTGSLVPTLFKVGTYTGSSPTSLTFSNTTLGSDAGFAGRFTTLNDAFQPDGESAVLLGFCSNGYVSSHTSSPDSSVWRQEEVCQSRDGGMHWTLTDRPFLQPPGTGANFYGTSVSGAWILKDPDDPNNLRPLMLNDEFIISFTGFDTTTPIQSGVLFASPGGGAGRYGLRVPASPNGGSLVPGVEFYSTTGDSVSASISARAAGTSTKGVDLAIGVNDRLTYSATQATYQVRDDTTKPGVMLVFHGSDFGASAGTADFVGWSASGVFGNPLHLDLDRAVVPSLLFTPTTFASLPASPGDGQCSWITDSNSTTFYAVAAGGGSNHTKVCWDGSNWRVH